MNVLKMLIRKNIHTIVPTVALLAETDFYKEGYDAVGTVVTLLVKIALPALILISIIKMIMNHIRS